MKTKKNNSNGLETLGIMTILVVIVGLFIGIFCGINVLVEDHYIVVSMNQKITRLCGKGIVH